MRFLALVLLAATTVAQPPGYAVVVSKATLADADWVAVVDALVTRHDGHVVPFEGAVTMARAGLTARMPGRTAFVLRPEEAGRDVVLDIHRMTRALDEDPYTDTLWGIVTGHSAGAALRLVAPKEPLRIERGVAGAPIDLEVFEEGTWFSETEAGVWFDKPRGGRVERKKGPQDSVAALAKAFDRTQFILTSGHATERDWQPGYSYKNGQFRAKDGVLVGIDMSKGVHPVRSSEPKVYLAAGNCLMGHVDGRDAMALAFMNSAGVRQLVGYTVVTWYGAGGWGTRDWFFREPGRRSFADAWFANNQRITWRLHREFKGTERVTFDRWRDIRGAMAKVSSARTDDRPSRASLRENTGLLWDRDTVAFLGDPAYDCRLKERSAPWTQKLKVQGDEWTFTVRAGSDTDAGGRVFAWLPHRIGRAEVIDAGGLEPVITDGFIMLADLGALRAGEERKVRFRARALVATPPAAPEKPTPAAGHADPAPATRAQLSRVLERCPKEQVEGMRHLIASLPDSDIGLVTEAFLLENVDYAYRAKNAVPWGSTIPDEIFFDHILPYASVNERREAWRKDFYERFIDIAKACSSPAEAMGRLNVEAFKTFGVSYHPSKRPKPDQSPYESIAAGYASCTGLSILLIDACRSVCVPARFVGTARWTPVRGNHSWVEVFDEEWLVIGACEPGEPNKTWFMGRAAQADASKRLNRIYAVDWRGGDTWFPMVWKRRSQEARACDVTPFYTKRQPTKIVVAEGKPERRALSVTLRHGGRIVAHVQIADEAPVVNLAKGESYDAEVRYKESVADKESGAERVRRVEVKLDTAELVLRL